MNAVFFDMDGTLIDSRADLAAAVNHTRRDLGMDPLPLEEVIANVGQGARHLFEKTICPLEEDGAAKPVAEPGVIDLMGGSAVPGGKPKGEGLLDVYRRHYAEHMLDSTELYPTVRSTLAELRDRGWLLGINTSKPRFATLAILEHFGMLRYFGNAIVAGGDCPEMKPSAFPLRECASRMNGHRLSSHDWMVGDAWTDMQCATNAGVKGAFCTYGFGQLRDSRATVRINRLEELLRYCRAED